MAAQSDVRECKMNLANSETELRIPSRKEESQNEADRLKEIAQKALMTSFKVEDVANVMLLAE